MDLDVFNDQKVLVIMIDGRVVVGTLRGSDKLTNLVLEGALERVYAPDAPMKEEPLGLYVIRGDNVAVVGPVDETLENSPDFGNAMAEPLAPIRL